MLDVGFKADTSIDDGSGITWRGIAAHRQRRPRHLRRRKLGLMRASSNKPELVVLLKSPVLEQRMHDMFETMNVVLRTHPEVGT